MKILVVGGSGFLGNEIVKQLLAEGNEVKSMSRSRDSNRIKNHFVADIAKPDTYLSVLQDWQPQVVVQCAWVTSQKVYRESSENQDYRTQTLQFAADCFKIGVNHFLGLGSSAEYGALSLPCNATLTSPQPVDPYGRNKFETFLKLQDLSGAANARLTWGRVFQPYGLGQDSNRLIPWATEKMLSGQEVKLQNPEMTLDWISSRDIASAISWSVNRMTPQAIDIGTSVGTSVRQVLEEVALTIGTDPDLVVSTVNAQLQKTDSKLVVSVDSPLLKDGWKPKDTLQTGLTWALGQ